MNAAEPFLEILGERITPERVREVIRKASQVRWGKHLLKWRFDETIHEGQVYKSGQMLRPDLWHLLKRIYVDLQWEAGTTIEMINQTAREIILEKDSELWVYGYYRILPARLQWGFYSERSGVLVIYDDKAEEITTVFKPREGSQFFSTQLNARKINRSAWRV